MKTIQEAIYYYRLNIEIACKVAKKMGITDEVTVLEYGTFINTTLNLMQENLAKKLAKKFGYKPSKVLKVLQAMNAFDEKSLNIEEFFERIV